MSIRHSTRSLLWFLTGFGACALGVAAVVLYQRKVVAATGDRIIDDAFDVIVIDDGVEPYSMERVA